MVQKTFYKVEYQGFPTRRFSNYDDAAKYLQDCKATKFERKLATFAICSPFIFIVGAIIARILFA